MVAIGYVRISTTEQDTALQIKALKQFGCDNFYEDKASDAKTDRLELSKTLPI